MRAETITSQGAQIQEISPSSRWNGFHSARLHWPEYLMEAGEVATYLFFTCVFATLLQHPDSPIPHLITLPIVRRGLMGLAIGATVTAIILTPWGKQSGGHLNPALTLAFYRLGKVAPWDLSFYVTAQFVGAAGGVVLAAFVLRVAPGNDPIRYAVTAPGVYGNTGAFVAELTISFGLMIAILFLTTHNALARYTPFFVGALYAVYITFEAPLSGMSMNPARTFGPALEISYWRALWIYFAAPTLGMLLAAAVFLRLRGNLGPYCAKLHHANNKRCIFRHGYRTAQARHF